jgi:hypothetical protein
MKVSNRTLAIVSIVVIAALILGPLLTVVGALRF